MFIAQEDSSGTCPAFLVSQHCPQTPSTRQATKSYGMLQKKVTFSSVTGSDGVSCGVRQRKKEGSGKHSPSLSDT